MMTQDERMLASWDDDGGFVPPEPELDTPEPIVNPTENITSWGNLPPMFRLPHAWEPWSNTDTKGFPLVTPDDLVAAPLPVAPWYTQTTSFMYGD